MIPIVGSTDPAQILKLASAVEVELTRQEWGHLVTAAFDAETF
jgi:predicted oxidoreductase